MTPQDTRAYLERWGNAHENRCSYLLPLALRIHEENPTWPAGRVWLAAKRRGTTKQLVSSDERGNLITGPNPDYIEPPSN